MGACALQTPTNQVKNILLLQILIQPAEELAIPDD